MTSRFGHWLVAIAKRNKLKKILLKMRYCNCLDKDIIQECKTDLGGIDKIYLINADDYIRADGENIYLKEGKMAYRIDHANNMANLTQNAVNTNDQTYINSVLTFTLRFHSVNLEDELMCLTLGYFKALVKYKNGYWRFVDEESSDWSFKQTAVVNDSGTTENDMNWYNQLWKFEGKDQIYAGIKVDGDNISEIISDLKNVKPIYESFDDFKRSIDT
mgnify:CR=1 FL=1